MVTHDLLAFIDKSPTPWHAVDEVSQRLKAAGFEELHERDAWYLQAGKSYFVVRQGTSICAFTMPFHAIEKCRIAAAHTDSPGFKLKPHAEYRKENMVMLGLEVYGAPLLTSWLNRDLGVAGRVICKEKGLVVHKLVRLESMPVMIPQLAIHLDRGVNENGLVLNKQEHLAALMGACAGKEPYLKNAVEKEVKASIIGWDLFVYPLEKAAHIGLDNGMVAGYRLDNLCGVHAILTGFLARCKATSHTLQVAVFWDHEEIGSETVQGAGSPFLPQTLERIAGQREDYFRLLSQSLCVSVDAGHALHPNYSDKHEPRHPLLLNEGVILKSSAQYRYATDAYSAATIVELCQEKNLKLQRFTSRGDIPAGTTIGPITAHLMGVATVDIGISQLSMHSCREVIGSQDQRDLILLMEAYFTEA